MSTPARPGKLPPGPPESFLLGHTLPYLRDEIGYLTKAVREYGDLVRLRLGNLTTYIVANPAHIEYVLRTHADNFMKDELTRWLIPLVGQGLLTSEGEFWRRQRRLIRPAFQFHAIQRYAAVMVEHTERMLATWHAGQVRNVHEDMMGLTLGIVAKTLFDADLEGEAKVVSESMETVMNYFMSPMRWFSIRERLPLPSTLRYRRAIKRIDDIIYGFIRQRRQSGHDPGDLLVAPPGRSGRSGRQRHDRPSAPRRGGHAACSPATKRRRWRLLTLFTCSPSRPRPIAVLPPSLISSWAAALPRAADVPNLKYTEWVVRETMRLYPPAWGVGRQALADCEIGGYRVPKGTQLFLVIWLVHHDGRWFSDPECLPPGAVGPRSYQATASLCLFPVRRRGAHLHRQPLRHDGGRAPSGDDRSEVPPEAGATPDARAGAGDHPSAPARPAHATGAATSHCSGPRRIMNPQPLSR